jgi:hypothetical protein
LHEAITSVKGVYPRRIRTNSCRKRAVTKRQFKIWLEGYLELSDETTLRPAQMIIILNHAKLVLVINKIEDLDIKTFINKIKLFLDGPSSNVFSRTELQILTHDLLTRV